jgi:hypothetical protein
MVDNLTQQGIFLFKSKNPFTASLLDSAGIL